MDEVGEEEEGSEDNNIKGRAVSVTPASESSPRPASSVSNHSHSSLKSHHDDHGGEAQFALNDSQSKHNKQAEKLSITSASVDLDDKAGEPEDEARGDDDDDDVVSTLDYDLDGKSKANGNEITVNGIKSSQVSVNETYQA